jgi:ABC-type nitrate/sulfonate/bicarbonate transport system permease component
MQERAVDLVSTAGPTNERVTGDTAPKTVRRRPKRQRYTFDLWRSGFSFLVFFIVWEVVARYVIANQIFLASPSDVAVRAVEMWETGELQKHVWISFEEFACGFVLAAVIGIAAGIALAQSNAIRGFFDPIVSLAYSMPVIALGPLFILWLGIGIASKIAVIFLVAVFPILINTVAGLMSTDRHLVEVAHSLGASPGQLYRKVRLPSAVPFIIAGLRLSVARALVGVVVAELFGARAGLGYLVMTSTTEFDTAALFLAVIILAVAGVICVECFKYLESWLAPWRFQNSEE